MTVTHPGVPDAGTDVGVIDAFADLGVSPAIVERLSRRGIDAPFPIQAATLADALAGRDVCGRAPTGSGKTLAFGIPLVERVGRARPRYPRGLVLVPTRELANQVRDELVLLAGRSGGRDRSGGSPSVATFFGGVGFGPQLTALRRGVDIAVACPGRLADLVNRGDFRLDEVEFVVLDEADRMADMGFLPEVKRLLDQVRPDRQTLLFSATLDGDVDVLVKRYQRKPARHELAVDEDEPQNEHVFWRVSQSDRTELTAEVVRRQWPAIVFCRTKRGADRLAQRLGRLGVAAAAIHGDRSQNQREGALAAFTRGKVQALVATDVAARGIHVDDVACVVHFDPPADEKDYVHRSGRTGRAGRTGLVVSLIGGDQVTDIKKMQRKLGLPQGVVAPDPAALGTGERITPTLQTKPAKPSVERIDDHAARGDRPVGQGRRRRPRKTDGGPQSSRGSDGRNGSRADGRPSGPSRGSNGGSAPSGSSRGAKGPGGRGRAKAAAPSGARSGGAHPKASAGRRTARPR